MTIDVTPRWGGPSDATASSTYKVERSVDLSGWTVLAASQAATTPYASPVGALSADTSYGATTIDLDDAGDFPTSGYGWLEEALVEWTGKSSNQLTGVVWHSGYGTYASGSILVNAHESYADTGVDPTNSAVIYRITHTDGNGRVSAPAYLWYYYPPTPASTDHCVVVVASGADLGVTRQTAVTVTCKMATDDQFGDRAGPHLDKDALAENSQDTNTVGLAHFHCWKNSARGSAAGVDAAYVFTIDDFTINVSTVPDRDWVLLSQVADSA